MIRKQMDPNLYFNETTPSKLFMRWTWTRSRLKKGKADCCGYAYIPRPLYREKRGKGIISGYPGLNQSCFTRPSTVVK